MLTNSYSNEPVDRIRANANNLAVIGFDRPITRECADHIPSGLALRETEGLIYELWKSNEKPVKTGVSGLCHWAEADGFLFTSIWLSEAECEDLQAATEKAYVELLAFIKQTDQSNLLRFWNYLPKINVGEGDSENYKLFCTGRLKAFQDSGIRNEDFPAATGIGHLTSGMTIYAISSAFEGQHHMNSRQQNAYHYPRQYGISSPSFARATSVDYPQGRSLFISGTASIIGHQTLHHGDLVAQLQITKENMLHLMEKAEFTQDRIQTMKVYVRHESDLEQTKAVLDKDFPEITKIFTIADICRSDLLVEVECFCS